MAKYNMKDRSERFDDTFKLLLTIETVMIAFSFALFQDIIEPKFFGVTVFSYILVLVFWCVPNIIAGFHIMRDVEYSAKVIGWYSLIALLLMTFLRLSSGVFSIDLSWEIMILLCSFLLSFPFTTYLKEYIPSSLRKLTIIVLIVMTVFMVCILLMIPH